MFGRIYKITNLINGCIYIGQSTKKGIDFDKYWGSGPVITSAIKNKGIENFKKEILIEGISNRVMLDELEMYFIKLFEANREPNYNLSSGGTDALKRINKKGKIGNKLMLLGTITQAAYQNILWKIFKENIDKINNVDMKFVKTEQFIERFYENFYEGMPFLKEYCCKLFNKSENELIFKFKKDKIDIYSY